MQKKISQSIFSRTQPLAMHLFTLMLVLLLPSLIFSTILIVRNDNARREAVYGRAEASASTVAAAFTRETSRMRTLLQVLSTKGALLTGNFEQVHSDTRQSLVESNNHFIVMDEDFNQIINTRVDYGSPLGKGSSTAGLVHARQSGEIEMSGLFFGRTSGEIVFNMSYFLERGSDEGIYLILTQNARDLVDAVEIGMMEGWHYAILDPDNQYAAGSAPLRSGQEFVFPQTWLSEAVSQHGNIVSYEGVEFLMASQSLNQEGWRAVVWVPAQIVEAPLQRTWLYVVLAGTLLLLISIGAAAGGAWVLSRPIKKLARDAHAMGEGLDVRASDSGIAEIDLVSRELAEAAHERLRREEEIRFLLNEVSHRAKNQLTVVGAIARQSLGSAGVAESASEALMARIHALSLSLDRLVGRQLHAASLKALVETQLDSFRSGRTGQIRINGPDIEIRPDAAQVLGLALHELATNACKYGALSTQGGQVNISWARRKAAPLTQSREGAGETDEPGEGDQQKADGAQIVLKWRESGGPAVVQPAQTGFGTRIIESYVSASLGAEVERAFQPEGFSCTIRMPVETVRPETGHE